MKRWRAIREERLDFCHEEITLLEEVSHLEFISFKFSSLERCGQTSSIL